ncbi:MAG TPA: hypothetical protein VJ990_02835 [Clostridia bacterium]|nr:hypothetical protein [Clostridia bacterium]
MTMKKKKIISILLWILVAVLIAFLGFLMLVRNELSDYIEAKYPDKTFSIGFTKIDPIYEKFYSRGTCLDDDTVFGIYKSWNTKKISDSYSENKNQNEYNEMIRSIFMFMPIQSEIKSVTGSGKTPYIGNPNFDQINFYLADEKDHAEDIEVILNRLEERKIEAVAIIMSYEKDGHVYSIRLSSEDYGLSLEEIKSRIEMIK